MSSNIMAFRTVLIMLLKQHLKKGYIVRDFQIPYIRENHQFDNSFDIDIASPQRPGFVAWDYWFKFGEDCLMLKNNNNSNITTWRAEKIPTVSHPDFDPEAWFEEEIAWLPGFKDALK